MHLVCAAVAWGLWNVPAKAHAVLPTQEHLPLAAPTVSLPTLAKLLGMRLEYSAGGKKATLKSLWAKEPGTAKVPHSLSFELHKREVSLDGQKVFIGFPVAQCRGELCIQSHDVRKTLQPLLQYPGPPRLCWPVRHIVIDPGHGGKDQGTENRMLKVSEKRLALDIAFRLEQLLRAQGYRVTLTRSHDRFVPLEERGQKSNAAGADLFVSLHLNAVAQNTPGVCGAETYLLPPQNEMSTARSQWLPDDREACPNNAFDTYNLLLAYSVQKKLTERLGTADRGVRKARYVVLKGVKCPAILVECGFLSHPQEAAQLATGAYRQRIAQAVAQGIAAYVQALESCPAPKPMS
jgi:N-acetylmuramoyl-L-alanine amidase